MKKRSLHNINETGLKTPDSYFESFDERLFAKINVQKEMAAIKNSGHSVPENYFENFDAQLQTRLTNEKQPKVRSFMSLRNAAYASGIAASLVLMLTVFTKSPDSLSINQVETASIEDYLNDENLNIYDIASLLNEEDLVLDNFVSNTLTEESLESYLLNNTSIEDLIFEK
ncbi:hypothetical protein [Gelidibacter mesophilus]|uniref:hypothetical protein n=1 Tax=Gelidibacter mesophilus TaxID=169050 RepID=UPI00041E3FBD|nr:hypothetical protein [Gelidibacter mesophilus]